MIRGIISFKIAVGVLITGSFSLFEAVQQFLIASIGGAIIGLLIGIALVRFRLTLTRRGIEILICLLFTTINAICYVSCSEMFHASGIILPL